MPTHSIVTESLRTVTKLCAVCNKSYEAKSNKAKFCTPACKLKSFRGYVPTPTSVPREDALVHSVSYEKFKLLEEAFKRCVLRLKELEQRVDGLGSHTKGEPAPTRKLSHREIMTYQNYHEASKKGGTLHPQEGWVEFAELVEPEGYGDWLKSSYDPDA